MAEDKTFDEFLSEHLDDESEQYREDFEKERFKLELAVMIREVRKSQELSQREFSKKVGISQSTLANIEKGNSQPNLNTMFEIARKNDKKLVISYE